MKEVLDIKVKRTMVPEYGKTTQEIKTTYKGYDITIPAGTRCVEISEREPDFLFVDDLSWIPKEQPCLKHDATYYGIHVKREQVKMEV